MSEDEKPPSSSFSSAHQAYNKQIASQSKSSGLLLTRRDSTASCVSESSMHSVPDSSPMFFLANSINNNESNDMFQFVSSSQKSTSSNDLHLKQPLCKNSAKTSSLNDQICVFCAQNKLNILGQGDLVKYKLATPLSQGSNTFFNEFKQLLSSLGQSSQDSLNK